MKKLFKKSVSIVLCIAMVMCACCAGVWADEAETEATGKEPVRISNVINGDTASSRGLCWYTKENTATKVEVFDLLGLPVNATVKEADVFEWEGMYVHKATVSGLEAGKAYTYRVGDGEVWSDIGTFTTDNEDDKVNFIAIADVQAGNQENFDKGAAVLAKAFEYMPAADFVANLGDFTDDSDNEEWDYYDNSFGAMNLHYTLAPIAGNHDGLGVENWFNNMFNLDTTESVQTSDGVNYSYDYGNVHVAVLNTNDILSISIPQLNWLKNDMNSTDKDWKIVLMHKSPYSLGKDAKWPDALYLQESLTRVLDACDVDLVMSGHDHMYLRTKPLTGNKLNDNGVTYVLSGTAGAKRYEVRSFLAGHFLDTDFIGAMTVQKDGYGNYWNGTDWNSTKETNIGGCFNTVSIDGGTLTLKSYILCDETQEVTQIDEYTVTKTTGQNKATFSGDNTTTEAEYKLGIVPSFLGLAAYAFTNWLPRFLAMVPELLYVYITEDTF